MNKNKLFKVFVMIAFIMCSCEDNFDPKMYGTLNYGAQYKMWHE